MKLFCITLLLLFSADVAVARPHHAPAAAASCWFPAPCVVAGGGATERTAGRRYRVDGAVVGHPAGCPRRAFCGCGASVRVFGHAVRNLYLASNWLRFPRAAPAPGMAAAKRGHVFVLESHVGGNTWIVYDANSGGRQTRIHARSLSGYTIVNPHA